MTVGWFILVILNVVMILQIVLKVCYFFKIYDKFGMLVQLIMTTVQEVRTFVSFMTIWLLAFALISLLLGANNDEN